MRGIVLIRLKDRDGARRDGIHKAFFDFVLCQGVLEAFDVLADWFEILHRNRTFADGAAIGCRMARFDEPVAVFGVIIQILWRWARGVAFEPGKPVPDVCRITY